MVSQETGVDGGGGEAIGPAVFEEPDSFDLGIPTGGKPKGPIARAIGGASPEQPKADVDPGADRKPSEEGAFYIVEVETRSDRGAIISKLMKVKVPPGATITFGPMVVGGASSKFPACFRVYAGPKKNAICIAAVTGVMSFWREDIKTETYEAKE